MFADLLPWPHRRAPAGYEHAFVRSVVVKRTDGRDPRLERFILVCWLLIAVKHAAILWALPHYHLPLVRLGMRRMLLYRFQYAD